MKSLNINIIATALLIVCTFSAAGVQAADTIESRVQGLKKEVLGLNREIRQLEQEVLFPSSTQLAVFVSLDVGQFFRPTSVKIKLNGKLVTSHLYTNTDIRAMKKGGVHRVYTGNIKMGKHELTAFATGLDQNNREVKLGTTMKFSKGEATKYVELRIRDEEGKRRAVFKSAEWE